MMGNFDASESDCEVEKCNLSFPECQYLAVGLDLERVIELSESWRRGEILPHVGHETADQVSDKLNQMTNQSQPTPLAK